jgi:lysophospholipase L1-like esterase
MKILLCVGFLTAALAARAQVLKVACIGDSVTAGANVDNPSINAYPVVLGRLLGTNYQTSNFGVSGCTLLRKGDSPYWNQPAFQNATNYAPDIVTILLGTNDSKPQNWIYADQFAGDLSDMVDVFARLPSHPRVLLCLPVPAYSLVTGINPDIIKNQIIPIIRQVARAKGIMSVDMYTPLSGRPDLFSDNIHPSTAGTALMAKTLHGALLTAR